VKKKNKPLSRQAAKSPHHPIALSPRRPSRPCVFAVKKKN